MSKFKFLFVLLCVLLLLINNMAYAQDDDTPTPEGGVIVTVEATEESTSPVDVIVVPEATEDPTVEVTPEPTPIPEDLPPVIKAYQDIIIWAGAFVLTALTICSFVIGALIKSNATLAKYASEAVPQKTVDGLIDKAASAKLLAENLTPNWKVDEEVIGGIHQQLIELRDLVYKATGTSPNMAAPPKDQVDDLLSSGKGLAGNPYVVGPTQQGFDPNAVG